jgi:hypothetical protein
MTLALELDSAFDLDLERSDPWSQTIHLLREPVAELFEVNPARSADSGYSQTTDEKGKAGKRVRAALAPHTTIRVIERPTPETATVYWSDASTCHYGHQGWRAATALVDGTCALSGRAIRRGDAVFRPANRGAKLKPLNASAMILASSMPLIDDMN